jgi:small subunit ribosomal protein S27Ae
MSKETEKPKLKEGEAETEEATETKETEPKEAEVIEEKPKKLEKPKPEKKRKKEKGVFSYYKIDEKGLTRLRPFCERCGPGYFMADHGNRYTCGHCGFTRYKQNEQ